jgi:hypothetical protein
MCKKLNLLNQYKAFRLFVYYIYIIDNFQKKYFNWNTFIIKTLNDGK